MCRLPFSEVAGFVKPSVHQFCHNIGNGYQGWAFEDACVEQTVLQGGVRCDDSIVAELVGVCEGDEHRAARQCFTLVEGDADCFLLGVEVVADGIVGVGQKSAPWILGKILGGLRVESDAGHAQEEPPVDGAGVDTLDVALRQEMQCLVGA